MHIVVVGAGGVGGYFGGKISKSGQKVTFIVRGKHLEAIGENGLQIKSVDGDFVTRPYMVTDKIQDVEKADLVLICTKSWQVVETAKQILPILKEGTMVIPLQNGADNVEKLQSVINKKHVLGGLCRIYSKIVSPGVISHFGYPPQIVFGEANNDRTERLQRVKQVFDKAGFENVIAEDIQVAIWSKFMFIASISGLGALTRVTIGEMNADVSLNRILEQTVTEIYTIGVAKGVALHEDMISKIMKFISKQSYDATASMQRDIMEGRPSELDTFNGFVIREGKRLGIETPVNNFIYNCLQPMEAKARK